MQARKWVVGDEYDEVAFARLKQALSDLQYSIRDQWNGVAGVPRYPSLDGSGPRRTTRNRERNLCWPFGRRALIVDRRPSCPVRANHLKFRLGSGAAGRHDWKRFVQSQSKYAHKPITMRAVTVGELCHSPAKLE